MTPKTIAIKFSVEKFFASGGKIREWETGLSPIVAFT
jgi:hypothetical protein